MTAPRGIGSAESFGAPAFAQGSASVLLGEEMADDAEEIIVNWLIPLRPSASVRLITDPLPFTLVTHITGSECEEESHSEPVVSVHTLCDKLTGFTAVKNECRLTHQRMLRLARHIDDIPISGRIANVEYVDVTESPIWVEYGDDAILQKVGRYRIGLTYVAVPVVTTTTEAT
jgi:hypothetical protein